MKLQYRNYHSIILVLLSIIMIVIFIDYVFMFIHKKHQDFVMNENIEKKKHLQLYGFTVHKRILTCEEADILKDECKKGEYKSIKNTLVRHPELNQIIEESTGSKQYQFQDYIWIIQKSSVHTCHRDNNGDFFNSGQTHPSYTMLVYLEDMEKCLSIIPESHIEKDSYFFDFNGSLRNIVCKKGDVVIFNANLIHVGTINEKEDNIRVQLKVTHKDDIQHIKYYEDFHKVLNQENTLPKCVRKFQRNMSCVFPGFSNWTQTENIRTSRGTDNGVNVGYPQQIFSYLFYGNKDFYDLPNAW